MPCVYYCSDFNTTFVHVERQGLWFIRKLQQNFNTTFVHVEPKANLNDVAIPDEFQYNICTCGAYMIKIMKSELIFISIQHLYMWSYR